MKRTIAFVMALLLTVTLLPAAVFAAGSPADAGWNTDGGNFTGWTLEGDTITCDYPTSVGNHRIWKQLLTDPNNFALSMTVTNDNKSSTYIQLLGVIVELDSNNGNGNQTFLKVNGQNYDWHNGTNCRFDLRISRKDGGKLKVELVGAGGSPAEVTCSANGSGADVELGMYRGGKTVFENITLKAPGAGDGGGNESGNKPSAGLDVGPTKATSAHWTLANGWVVNEADTHLVYNGGNGNAIWGQKLDVTKDITMSMDWVTGTTIAGNDKWGEELGINLKDDHTGDYLFIRLKRYKNGNGRDQVYLQAQYWNESKKSWSNNLLDVWGMKAVNANLNDIHVTILRDAEQESLQIVLLDNDNDFSLSKGVIKKSNFSDTALAENYLERILANDALTVEIWCPNNGQDAYTLSNPVYGVPEKEISQNRFTGDPVWKAQIDENGLAFATANGGSGWLEYNAGLDGAAFGFTYDVTALEYNGEGYTTNLFRLRYSESPEEYVLARIFFSKNGEIMMECQMYKNNKWHALFSTNGWVKAPVSDNTWRVGLTSDGGKFTVTFNDTSGKVLCSFGGNAVSDGFTACTNLELMFHTEGHGLHKISNFRGLPEVYSPDLRSEPFTTVVFAGELTGGWTQSLLADITEYQNKEPAFATAAWSAEEILGANGNLVILSHGVSDLLGGKSAQSFAAELADMVRKIKDESTGGTVIVVTGLPYIRYSAMGQVSLQTLADYNAAIRETAEQCGVLYANLYSALAESFWGVDADGKTVSESGNYLVAGEILQELLRSCTCLAVNNTMDLKVSATTPVAKTEAALQAFRSAADAMAMEQAVTDPHLGADLDIFHTLTLTVRQKVMTALVAVDRSGVDSFEKADALINGVCMAVSRENVRPMKTGAPFGVYVAVGDSISHGETAVNKATDGWVPRLAQLISAMQGQEVTLINKAISGTRMCTITDNKMFPAAKDTVQEYIVSNNPDFITISYGINDLHAGTSLTEFITTYRQYLTEVVAGCPDAVIMINGLSAKGSDADSALLQTWNREIQALAEEFGLIYNDTYFDTRGVEWLLSDGLHPTNAGYRVMAQSALRALNAYVDLTGKTTAEDMEDPDVPPTQQPSDPTDPSDPVQPSNPEDPSVPTQPSEAPTQTEPGGSSGNMGWLIGLGVAVAAAVAVVVVVLRKKKS